MRGYQPCTVMIFISQIRDISQIREGWGKSWNHQQTTRGTTFLLNEEENGSPARGSAPYTVTQPFAGEQGLESGFPGSGIWTNLPPGITVLPTNPTSQRFTTSSVKLLTGTGLLPSVSWEAHSLFHDCRATISDEIFWVNHTPLPLGSLKIGKGPQGTVF